MASDGRKSGRYRKGDGELIASLAAGYSIKSAAVRASVGERTVQRRLAEPEFRDQVRDAREAFIQQTVGALAMASAQASITLSELLKADSEMARLGAARVILEQAMKYRDSDALESRIERLEVLLEQSEFPSVTPIHRKPPRKSASATY